ncbi:MAG: hypothetical protein ACREQ8_04040 [Woeseiaceae bacterium]
MAAAEDVAVVNALVANKCTRIIDHQYFSGKPHDASTENTILYFDQEYRPPFYGHISFLGLDTHLISPFAAGLAGTAIESLYPTNTDVLREAKQQDALGVTCIRSVGPTTRSSTGLAARRHFQLISRLGRWAIMN